MIYEVTWSVPALDRAAGYLRDDPDGVEAVLDAADTLAAQPRLEASTAVAGPSVRRLRVGRYRLLYEVVEGERRVVVVHLGRVG